MGISSIFSCAIELLMTISLANSIPGMRRFIFRTASRRKARIPQCESPTPVLKRTFRKTAEQRVADPAVGATAWRPV